MLKLAAACVRLFPLVTFAFLPSDPDKGTIAYDLDLETCSMHASANGNDIYMVSCIDFSLVCLLALALESSSLVCVSLAIDVPVPVLAYRFSCGV